MRALQVVAWGAVVACGGKSEAGTCPVPKGTVVHDADEADVDATWSASAGVHVVRGSVQLDDVTLTLEPCVTVRLEADASLTLQGGALIAIGTEKKPIVFEREGERAWGAVTLRDATGQLAWTTLRGGGSDTFADFTALLVEGPDTPEGAERVTLDHVTIEDSAGPGLSLRSGATAAAGGTLTVRRSGVPDDAPWAWGPVVVEPVALTTLPALTLQDNAGGDEVVLELFDAGGDLAGAYVGDVTIRDLGVPYRVGRNVEDIFKPFGADGRQSSLTIEAGVELRFVPGARLDIESHPAFGGSSLLIAQGTADRPIRFTSAKATPAAGDWVGLTLDFNADADHAPPAGSRLDHVEVSYAGYDPSRGGYVCPEAVGDETQAAGIAVLNGNPGGAWITHTTVRDTVGHGFLRGWQSPDQGPVQTFLTDGNAVIRVTSCDETGTRDAFNACEDNASCGG
ncbi:MAG: hypothetical protein RLZZ383_2817 [Pseudomonadota bacterium]